MKIFSKILIFLLFFIFPKPLYANDDFSVELLRSYEISKDGKCNVNEIFNIKNLKTGIYLPSFEYKISGMDADNIKVLNNDLVIEHKQEQIDDTLSIKINFSDKILGKGNNRQFHISYETNNIASRTGDVWEIVIPNVHDINYYNDISVHLRVPKDFGQEAYIMPHFYDKKVSDDDTLYIFDKQQLLSSKLVAAFGSYQSFSFSIKYHLKNDLPYKRLKSVSIPMDTSYQRVFLQNIDKPLKNVTIDEDGNWIAEFEIPGGSESDITVSGYVQLFAQPRKHLIPAVNELYNNIKPTSYWNSDERFIINLSKELVTPQMVYDYVLSEMDYDYDLSNYERRGASKILSGTTNGICRDFTDLFISLMRAKGIPAREVIGYAHTDNPEIKPVLFFNDILHSWVEYWNSDDNVWVSVDPTWGKTSDVDYLNSFDLKHFAFTIHGADDSNPAPPGAYIKNGYEKDIFVNIGQFPENIEKPIVTNLDLSVSDIIDGEIDINIINENGFALYERNIKYYMNEKLIAEDNYKAIPPYSTINKKLSFKRSLLGKNTASQINISINGEEHIYEGPKKIELYFQLIIIFSLFIILSLLIYYFTFKRGKKISI